MLQLAFGEHSYAQHLTFNWFSVEKVDGGRLIHLAWVARNVAVEIYSVIISSEGLNHLRESSTRYIQTFSANAVPEQDFPSGKVSPPRFSNFVRLSRAGNWAEIGFYLIPLADIAGVAKGEKKDGKTVPIGLAIAHSANPIHEQLVLTLLSV